MTILTTGVFDLGMHVGHFLFLMECKKLAGENGRLIVGVNSDWSVEQYKRKPVFDQFERVHAVEQLPFVDDVFQINSEEDIKRTIEVDKVDYYVKGAEWAGKTVTGSNLCTVIFLNPIGSYYTDKISTTNIIKRVHEYHQTNQADNK